MWYMVAAILMSNQIRVCNSLPESDIFTH